MAGFALADPPYRSRTRVPHVPPHAHTPAASLQVHHSSEDYNQTTALRQSALQTYTSFIFYLPAALVLPPPMFAAHKHFNVRRSSPHTSHPPPRYSQHACGPGLGAPSLFQTLYQYWIHTELIGKLGPIEWIMNTPSHHRVHHGRNPYCIDHNYGAGPRPVPSPRPAQ